MIANKGTVLKVAAVVLGGIILKFWRQILTFIATTIVATMLVVSYFCIYILAYIILLPATLFIDCIPDEKFEKRIIQNYDYMFYEASDSKELAEYREKIRNMQYILQKRKERRDDKRVKRLLEEAKWVL